MVDYYVYGTKDRGQYNIASHINSRYVRESVHLLVL